jgi:hypothetical protein
MKPSTLIWTILFILGGVFLLYRAVLTEHGMGKEYVRKNVVEYVQVTIPPQKDSPHKEPVLKWVKVDSDDAERYEHTDAEILTRTTYGHTTAKAYAFQNKTYPPPDLTEEQLNQLAEQQEMTPEEFKDELETLASETNGHKILLSIPRTIGVWLAAFFTLCIFSFLYKDNPFYKLAESVVVGVSAAYWMVIGFWSTVVANLFGKITPGIMRDWGTLPSIKPEAPAFDWGQWPFLLPLVLGVMLLWRLAPKGAWISRWPLAFIVGTTAGIRLFGFLGADFLSQITNTIQPFIVLTNDTTYPNAADAAIQTAKNFLLFVGVISGLVYFFFSIEHEGVVGKISKIGIWFLMITFGAGFGYTVMGRIALLAIRLEFLFDQWLWIVNPSYNRPPGW